MKPKSLTTLALFFAQTGAAGKRKAARSERPFAFPARMRFQRRSSVV